MNPHVNLSPEIAGAPSEQSSRSGPQFEFIKSRSSIPGHSHSIAGQIAFHIIQTGHVALDVPYAGKKPCGR